MIQPLTAVVWLWKWTVVSEMRYFTIVTSVNVNNKVFGSMN